MSEIRSVRVGKCSTWVLNSRRVVSAGKMLKGCLPKPDIVRAVKQRQDLASTGYFMQVAETTERSSAKMWAAVATVPPERAPSVSTTGWKRKFDGLIALYSAGAAADEVVDGSLELVAQIGDLIGVPVLEPSRLLQVAAFVAMGAPEEQRQEVAGLLKLAGETDGVAHSVWLASEVRDVDSSVSHPAYRAGIAETVALWSSGDSTGAVDRLRVYVESEWYSNHADSGWHDTHKRPESMGFVGYWCFEAAATVNALSLDDSALLSARYYPGELAAAGRRRRSPRGIRL